MEKQNEKRLVTIKYDQTAKRFIVKDLSDWQPVADHLAKLLASGSIVALSGPLGAGKTTLVQYLARTLGAPKRATSPTFALIRIYKVRSTRYAVRRGLESYPITLNATVLRTPYLGVGRLVHVDAYRIEDEKDLIALDLDEELLDQGTAVLVEWPENIKGWFKDKNPITVNIEM